MQVKFYRTSGFPPNPILKDAKKEAMRSGFDEVEARLGKFDSNGENKDQWPEELNKLDQSLREKYEAHEWRELGSVDEIKELIKFYGTTLAFCLELDADKKEEVFTCYIMDNP